MRLPHHNYRFRVITFEHDLSFGGQSERNSSRRFLQELGYQLVVGDVSWGDHVVEDWWVDPNLTDPKIIKRLCALDSAEPHRHDEYFYNQPSRHYVRSDRDRRTGADKSNKLDKGICIDGWRGINHSFALVNQWQLLELLRHPVRLRHRDAPLPNSKWNTLANNSGLPEDMVERIRHIPNPNHDDFFSVLYRIGFPMNMSDGNADRVFVFGTTEFGYCPDDYIEKGSSLSEATRKNIQIITPSHWAKRGFINSGYPGDLIHIVPHGVSTKIFRPSSSETRSIYRQMLGFTDHDFLLLNVSALTDNKGVDLLLKAYGRLKKRYKELKLIIKDQSNLYGLKLEQVLEKIKASDKGAHLSDAELQDIVPISDNLDMETLQALYNACDAYVSPYRNEGFNLPPLEAAACGLPIIVTAGGATDDYFSPELGLQIESNIRPLDGGYYLEPDINALEDAIEKIILTPERWGGKKGSDLVHKQFGWERIGEQLWDLLA